MGIQPGFNWFAVHSRAKHEFQVSERLAQAGIEAFVPYSDRLSTWSDRKKIIRSPLFPGYLFVHVQSVHSAILSVQKTKGVVRVLGPMPGEPEPVPEEQIVSLKKLVEAKIDLDPYPYLKEGQRVRIKNGPLAGVEGILVEKTDRHMLVLSVDILRQSTAVTIDVGAVEAV